MSLGGASVVFAAAEDADVAGVICDSSFRSLDDTVRHHLQLFRGFRWWLRLVPAWPVADLTVFWMGRRGGFDPAAADVRAAAARLAGRPALFVANSDDRRMPKEIAFDLKAAAGPGAEVLIVPGKSHGGAWRDGRRPTRRRPRPCWRRPFRAAGRCRERGEGRGTEARSTVSDEKPHHHAVPGRRGGGAPPPADAPTPWSSLASGRSTSSSTRRPTGPRSSTARPRSSWRSRASLAAKCQGCLEGHVKKALKFGATREEVSEAIAIAIGVNAAAIVDLTDIAADNMNLHLFPGPEKK